MFQWTLHLSVVMQMKHNYIVAVLPKGTIEIIAADKLKPILFKNYVATLGGRDYLLGPSS